MKANELCYIFILVITDAEGTITLYTEVFNLFLLFMNYIGLTGWYGYENFSFQYQI